MSNLTSRLGLIAGLLAAATVTAMGCHSTLPSIFLAMEDPTELGPQQLRVTVRVEGQDTVSVIRPETPGAAMQGTQTMRLLMPEASIGQTARLSIEALIEGEIVGNAETVTRVAADEETLVSVALVPGKPGCVGLECGCNATTCPSGCCDGNTCVQGSFASCGTAGGACAACPAETSDRCVEGGCRCGPDAPCPDGYACEAGRCRPTGSAPACRGAEDCTSAPGQCHEAQGRCGADGSCVYDLKAPGTACDDGNSCTTGDACTAEGVCNGAPRVCNGGTGCLATDGQCVNGSCLYAPLAQGTPCSDGNACTSGETCNGAGSCIGGAATVCNSPPSACHESTGTCGTNGACTYAVRTGQSCNDNNACTTGETCNASGACGGGTAKVCNSPPSQCHQPTGTCGADGQCSYALRTGQSCNDNNACTTGETCNASGACGGGTAKVCNSPPSQCHQPTGTCGADGQCTYALRTGGSCNDGNACTANDTCNANGTCVGSAPAANGLSCGGYNSCRKCSGGVCGYICTGNEECRCGDVCVPPNTECP